MQIKIIKIYKIFFLLVLLFITINNSYSQQQRKTEKWRVLEYIIHNPSGEGYVDWGNPTNFINDVNEYCMVTWFYTNNITAYTITFLNKNVTIDEKYQFNESDIYHFYYFSNLNLTGGNIISISFITEILKGSSKELSNYRGTLKLENNSIETIIMNHSFGQGKVIRIKLGVM